MRGRSNRRAGAAESLDAAYWDAVAATLAHRGHYMDAFVGELKIQAYLQLLQHWGWQADGPQLKTDLFEESTGVDALLWRMPTGSLRIGMDLAPSAVASAASNDPQGELACLVADARHLPLASDSLAYILSPSTLDHFEVDQDLHVSLRELYRVLKPGGRLVITLANRSNIGDPLLRLLIRIGLTPYFIGTRYTAAELRRELEAADFRVLEQTAIVHHPRLMATAFARIGRIVRWTPLVRAMEGLLLAMQRLESTRLRYATGCFVAALAEKPAGEAS
jgi:SAM-dependent methyltransferase